MYVRLHRTLKQPVADTEGDEGMHPPPAIYDVPQMFNVATCVLNCHFKYITFVGRNCQKFNGLNKAIPKFWGEVTGTLIQCHIPSFCAP